MVCWNAFDGAAKYRVYRKNSSGKWVKQATVTELNYRDAEAVLNEDNTYAVLAVAANGTLLSDYGKGTTIKFILPCTPLGATIKSTGVRLEWEAMIERTAKYQVFRKTKSTDWEKIGTTSGLSYTDKTVVSGKNYYYSVLAVDEKGTAMNDYGEGILVKYRAASATATDVKSGFSTEEIAGEGIVEEVTEETSEEIKDEEETSEETSEETKDEEDSEETSEAAEDEEESSEETSEESSEETSEDTTDGEETSGENEDGEEASEETGNAEEISEESNEGEESSVNKEDGEGASEAVAEETSEETPEGSISGNEEVKEEVSEEAGEGTEPVEA